MNGTLASQRLSRLDRVGVCISLGCAVQCLAMPLLITVLPLAGLGLLLDGPMETFFIGASMTLAVVSLCWGVRVHRRWGVFLILGAAMGLMLVGRWAVAEPYELLLVVMGALLLATMHLLNHYLCRLCMRCQDGGRHGAS
jgi:MerC mercury resistance protein